jgi:ABC-2 type transport system permease protein
MWQLLLCVGIMLATIYGLLLLAARIYRIGILMYGKRPTLPELRRWLRYAG